MTRAYVVDLCLPDGQRIAAYVEADSYQTAVGLAHARHPDASDPGFAGTAPHDDALHALDVTEPSAPRTSPGLPWFFPPKTRAAD